MIKTVTGPQHTVTNSWNQYRDILTSRKNEVGETEISGYLYGVNEIGQRTDLTTTFDLGGDLTSNPGDTDWGYNARGEVTKADHTIPGLDRAYVFDGIGNRLKSAEGTTNANDPSAKLYTPTALNQYDAIGTLNPEYDPDGNMTNGPIPADPGVNSILEWDAENRLVEVQVGTSGTLVRYTYDAQSRRIAETIGASTKLHVYDGWNPIAEYSISNNQYSISRAYTWGIDLSGSMQGAGGVGGLLAVTASTGTYYPTYDGNGNVSEYLNSAGTVVAHYEYDPFGRTTLATGSKPNDFAHRFSTKPLDLATGLYYYGYRWYDPMTGRWPSRDPIEERGGMNLYGMVKNRAVSRFDVLGLWPADCPCKTAKDISKEINNMVNSALGPMPRYDTPAELRKKIERALINAAAPPMTNIEAILEKEIAAGRISGDSCDCRGKYLGVKIIKSASSIKVCGQCIGTDKLGHFFEEGLVYSDIAEAKGQDYADAWGNWQEGLTPPKLTPEIYDWLDTANSKERMNWAGTSVMLNGGYGNYGDRGLIPEGDASPSDVDANEAGQSFWDDLKKGGFGGFGMFDICKYMKGKNLDHTTPGGKNVPQVPKPKRP